MIGRTRRSITHTVERQAGDLGRLRTLAARQVRAEQKDRYLVAFHAVLGLPTADIEQALAHSRGFAQRWANAYRDGGIGALRD
ncbi:MAG: hypothetical protein KJZ65_08370 [Phycisphaerales bacterium]|nr:hypothetical protein [Phycisphaerales bacterium]